MRVHGRSGYADIKSDNGKPSTEINLPAASALMFISAEEA
jgi:hypothetical protein